MVVSVRNVDDWADKLRNEPSLTLHLDGAASGNLLAESRLVGLFAEARFQRRTVHLRVAESVPLSYFSDHLLGAVLGMLADTIVSASGRDLRLDIRKQLRRSIAKDNGIVGSDSEFMLPVMDLPADDGGFAQFPLLADPGPSTFPSGMERLLKSLFQNRYSGDFGFVSQFLFEMWQNTIDHALDDLRGKRIDGFRCIIAKLRTIGSAGIGAGGIESDYVTAIRERFGPALHALMEVTVCDSGVGIGARMSGNPNFRELTQRAQVEHVQRAMTRGGSSKKRGGSGLGYPKALQAIDRVRGLLLLKTGELSAGKTYLPPHDPWPDDVLYSVLLHSNGVVRGTAVSLVLPVIQDN